MPVFNGITTDAVTTTMPVFNGTVDRLLRFNYASFEIFRSVIIKFFSSFGCNANHFLNMLISSLFNINGLPDVADRHRLDFPLGIVNVKVRNGTLPVVFF